MGPKRTSNHLESAKRSSNCTVPIHVILSTTGTLPVVKYQTIQNAAINAAEKTLHRNINLFLRSFVISISYFVAVDSTCNDTLDSISCQMCARQKMFPSY